MLRCVGNLCYFLAISDQPGKLDTTPNKLSECPLKWSQITAIKERPCVLFEALASSYSSLKWRSLGALPCAILPPTEARQSVTTIGRGRPLANEDTIGCPSRSSCLLYSHTQFYLNCPKSASEKSGMKPLWLKSVNKNHGALLFL